MRCSPLAAVAIAVLSGVLATLVSCAAPAHQLRLADGGIVGPGDVVTPPLAVTRVNPVYPADLRRSGIQGGAELEVLVSETGLVKDIQVVSRGDGALAEAAVRAVRQWRFEPATVNGQARAAYIHVSMRFTLQ